jgi:hypothetical protein
MLFPAYGIAVRAVIDCAEAGPLSARTSAISAAKWMARHRATRRRDFCTSRRMALISRFLALRKPATCRKMRSGISSRSTSKGAPSVSSASRALTFLS